MLRAPDQIPANIQYFLVYENTTWIYPINDINTALSTTTIPFTFDGTNIVCPTLQNFIDLYLAVFAQTAISQPVGNVGFSLGVGTQCADYGNEIVWQVAGSGAIVKWRLMKQVTKQSDLLDGGNSPQGTIGYGTVWTSYVGVNRPNPDLDQAQFIRVG